MRCTFHEQHRFVQFRRIGGGSARSHLLAGLHDKTMVDVNIEKAGTGERQGTHSVTEMTGTVTGNARQLLGLSV